LEKIGFLRFSRYVRSRNPIFGRNLIFDILKIKKENLFCGSPLEFPLSERAAIGDFSVGEGLEFKLKTKEKY
jgi:hypothetical protein